MAAVLLAAGSKGQAHARCRTARIMIHQPLGGARGQATDIEIQAREIRHVKDVITDIPWPTRPARPKTSSTRISSAIFYLSAAAQAKEYGLIDEVIVPRQEGGAGENATRER